MSGLQAARAIAACEQGKISEALAAQRYSQWVQTCFIQDPVMQRSREYMTSHASTFPKCLELSHQLAIPSA